MINWIKRLIASYDKLIQDEPKKKRPKVYRIGNKRYVLKKKIRFKK